MPSQEYFNLYLDNCDFYQEEDEKVRVSYGLETRSRQGDITDALRFRVYDPLWMLSRQWQLGEFKGNDAGTAMSVNCRVRWRPIGPDGNQTPPDEVEPLEPLVEQIQRDITPIARVESAAYLTDLLFESDSLTDQQRYAVVRDLRFRFPLDLDEDDRTVTERSSIESEPVRAFTASRNKRLARFRTAYEGKSFDGYKLYQHLKESELLGIPKVIAGKYVDWFTKRYLPEATAGTWKTKSLGYEMQVSDSAGHYEADDYPGGRLSWYSVDLDHGSEGTQGARDGDVFDLGDCRLRVIETPGHTIGSICLYDEVSSDLFSGDCFFVDGVGRCDHPTASPDDMRASLRKLRDIDFSGLYSGHGPVVKSDGKRFLEKAIQIMG